VQHKPPHSSALHAAAQAALLRAVAPTALLRALLLPGKPLNLPGDQPVA
jgi:hypothetical protein